jgi:guanylate kinase
MIQNGKLIIIAAPSGAGKTTIVKHILQQFPQLSFSVSATTRPIREGEKNGKDYYFLAEQEFKSRIANDEFIEWEMVYVGKYYGTLKSELLRVWNNDQHIIFDVDVEGGLHIKNKYPTNSLAIFINPPSLETLKQRLTDRNTESDESLNERISKAEHEMSFASEFDVVLTNDDLLKALLEAEQLIKDFLEKKN